MDHILHTLSQLNLTWSDVSQMSEYELTELLEYIKLTRPEWHWYYTHTTHIMINTYTQLSQTIDKLQKECKVVTVTQLPSQVSRKRRSMLTK